MKNNQMPWPSGIPEERIGSNQIHIWRASLNVSELQVKSLLEILSVDEIERAGRFHFERDQKRFIAGRGMLRQMLGLYLAIPPQDIRFKYASHGKPLIHTDSKHQVLHFNLSHSAGVVLYAFAHNQPIGIDLEGIKRKVEIEQIAKRFFSPEEIHSLQQVPPHIQSDLFFQYWTRKEAFLKAIGKGVSFPMEQVDVSAQSGQKWAPVNLKGDSLEHSNWYGRDLFLGQGYAGAIVTEGKGWEISCREYQI